MSNSRNMRHRDCSLRERVVRGEGGLLARKTTGGRTAKVLAMGVNRHRLSGDAQCEFPRRAMTTRQAFTSSVPHVKERPTAADNTLRFT
jgi:hypothetical protein